MNHYCHCNCYCYCFLIISILNNRLLLPELPKRWMLNLANKLATPLGLKISLNLWDSTPLPLYPFNYHFSAPFLLTYIYHDEEAFFFFLLKSRMLTTPLWFFGSTGCNGAKILNRWGASQGDDGRPSFDQIQVLTTVLMLHLFCFCQWTRCCCSIFPLLNPPQILVVAVL